MTRQSIALRKDLVLMDARIKSGMTSVFHTLSKA